jgi:hypothetical protein
LFSHVGQLCTVGGQTRIIRSTYVSPGSTIWLPFYAIKYPGTRPDPDPPRARKPGCVPGYPLG